MQRTLTSGHYYLGVRNDDTGIGCDYRPLTAELKIFPVSNNSQSILVDSIENLKASSLPWRKQFEITPEQEPAILTLTLSIPVCNDITIHSFIH